MLEDLPENALTERIIGCAIEVHRTYGGPGLKEFAYEVALEWELRQAGLTVERQRASGRLTRSTRSFGDTEDAFRGRLGFASPSTTASQSNLRAFVSPRAPC